MKIKQTKLESYEIHETDNKRLYNKSENLILKESKVNNVLMKDSHKKVWIVMMVLFVLETTRNIIRRLKNILSFRVLLSY